MSTPVTQADSDAAADMLEALQLADALLRGANMNRALVEKKVKAALTKGRETTIPQDVTNLVIAARIVAFEDQSLEALSELDKAVEAFASRVPWDNDPEVLAELGDAR